MEEYDFSVTIIGLGLIGGSYAEALMKLKLSSGDFKPKYIYGVDINKNNIEEALRRGLIDEGYLEGEVPLKKSHILILAIYPSHIPSFIKENIEYIKAGTIITDTSGIKEKLLEDMKCILPKGVYFVGGHPMAGKEKQGIQMASRDIFTGCNYIITPSENSTESSIAIIENIARAIGSKNVIRISPKQHDEIIAYTSHLPHIIAVSLMNSNDTGIDASSFIGGSFRDATRVAAINLKLWSELLIDNGEYIINRLDAFDEKISEIREAIVKGDRALLEHRLHNGLIKDGE
ncbi:MAG TPA: prephenate dehydrogenase [Clostridiaceae bacterium]